MTREDLILFILNINTDSRVVWRKSRLRVTMMLPKNEEPVRLYLEKKHLILPVLLMSLTGTLIRKDVEIYKRARRRSCWDYYSNIVRFNKILAKERTEGSRWISWPDPRGSNTDVFLHMRRGL